MALAASEETENGRLCPQPSLHTHGTVAAFPKEVNGKRLRQGQGQGQARPPAVCSGVHDGGHGRQITRPESAYQEAGWLKENVSVRDVMAGYIIKRYWTPIPIEAGDESV